MTFLEKLKEIRDYGGPATTVGLEDEILRRFAESHPDLVTACDMAYRQHQHWREKYDHLLKLPEDELVAVLQQGYVNFYEENAVNPYVALAAKGPWLVTTHGAVLHDSGGYGMLGFGHSPAPVLKAMNQEQVMANVMTPSFSQHEFWQRLKAEIGHNRPTDRRDPYARFLCVNSGSESVTIAARISDLNARMLTDPGQRYHGRDIKLLSLKGGFHGRTDRPAQASDSSLKAYQKLASFRDRKNLLTVEPNNVEALEDTFRQAEKDNVFIEMMLIEPVMGEGNPGVATTRAFYDRARELTKKMGTLLLVDSIQAGLRANGCLSITDYPGFEDCEAPDMETFSKAVNAGQYPLSILALRQEAADLYVHGLYGNTMTTNPRALDVACAVLDMVTDNLRLNIRERGQEFLQVFGELQKEFPDIVTGVSGTGLLCALHLNPDGYKVVGDNCVEKYMRRHGIGVIHGGKNALRFTPHFRIQSDEIQLIADKIRQALREGPIFS
jgi:acetylornithine/succinyldiaminopimelate/putrescine aminotransferase